MKSKVGTTGLIFNEPLLWEKSRSGRQGFSLPACDVPSAELPADLEGQAPDLPELNELDVVRHYTRLSQWNFGVDSGMYPLGSCTMKYNPKINEKVANLPGFGGAHPLLPGKFSQGALRLMYELQEMLAEITGFDATSLQPSAGAQGELTGIMVIRAYHEAKGEKRDKILVPDTAHGTNPASASLNGYQSIPVASNELGVLSPQAVAEKMDETTAGIMVTNPNTVGLFESNIKEVAEVVHSKGGLLYGDGANMNAVMGMLQPGKIGVDVMHLNLHKTFSGPHGGGGPGSGPICVTKALEPFLPVPRVVKNGDSYELSWNHPQSIGKMHAFYGNFGVMVRAYAYIMSMGAAGLKKASQLAVLNANYIKEMLKGDYHLPFDMPCMHECVFNDEKQEANKVSTLDIAKRLMDYGFHPPTVYFPLVVHGAIMIEPTETESKQTIDEFIAAMKAIAQEAVESPGLVRQAPNKPKLTRLDETGAARKPCLAG